MELETRQKLFYHYQLVLGISRVAENRNFDEAKLHSCVLVADKMKNTEFVFVSVLSV
jgi:hypothetical protein